MNTYVGRQIDIAAFQGFPGGQEVLLRQALADDGQSGKLVTGIAKLGQRFLLELLTERGSMPFDTERGSTFMQEARLGYIRSQTDLIAAYTRAMLDISRTLIAEEADSDPLDERFQDAVLASVEFSPGSASMSIQLSSLDPAAQLVIPVPLAF